MKKTIILIAGICGILVGIYILYAAIADLAVPKPLWLLFTVCCFISAIVNFSNLRKNK